MRRKAGPGEAEPRDPRAADVAGIAEVVLRSVGLRQQGVTQVFVTGAMAAIGVESTARTANNLGYNTVTIVDAMTDFDAGSYQHSVEKIFPRISERATTDEVLGLLG